MRSRMLRLVAAASVLAIAMPGAALADTTGPATPLNDFLVQGTYSFVDHGITFTGIAQVEDERISGQRNGSLFFSGPGKSKLCDGGTPNDPTDDYTGTQIIEYAANVITINDLQVDQTIASGSFDIATTGRRITTDACTGVIIHSKPEHHRFTLQVVASGTPVTSEDTSIVDGSQVTERFAMVAAAGTASIDRTPVTVSDGSLQHLVITVTPL